MQEASISSSAIQLEVFLYEVDGSCEQAPEWTLWSNATEDAIAQSEELLVQEEPPEQVLAKLVEERRQAFELGRLQGLQEERAAQDTALFEAEELRRTQAANLIECFAQERAQYFQSVERETVRLALSIAASILMREAQINPLLLAGMVRVALGQLAENTETRIIVPETELELWAQTLRLAQDCSIKPLLIGDKAMRGGECRIESTLGSADLGVRAQLHEIECGFFDGDFDKEQIPMRQKRNDVEMEG